MAKKRTPKQPIGPKKNRGLFGKATSIRASPDPFADLQKYDDQVQREQRIDVQQQPEQRVDDVLSEFMAPFGWQCLNQRVFQRDRQYSISLCQNTSRATKAASTSVANII